MEAEVEYGVPDDRHQAYAMKCLRNFFIDESLDASLKYPEKRRANQEEAAKRILAWFNGNWQLNRVVHICSLACKVCKPWRDSQRVNRHGGLGDVSPDMTHQSFVRLEMWEEIDNSFLSDLASAPSLDGGHCS